MLEVIQNGGPIMIPLGLASVLALAIIVERSWNLRETKILPPSEVEHLYGLIDKGEFDRAEEFAASRPGALNNTLLPALQVRRESREYIREVVRDAGRQEIPGLERYLGVLGTIASIAPLLGLLGTVLGMIQVFAVVSQQGVGQADALAGGISQAMITTATGLAIAGHGGVCMASIGTDGVDGATPAAGAFADGSSVARARALGMDPAGYLDDNDSYTLLAELGDLVTTGPTGTNVMDLQIAVSTEAP